jgi:hypothetical protein
MYISQLAKDSQFVTKGFMMTQSVNPSKESWKISQEACESAYIAYFGQA